MKNILILAGGTAVAWHISKTIKEHYRDSFRICICDVNQREFVPASIYADRFERVPYISDKLYRNRILEIIKDRNIDIIIPIIDDDLFEWAADDDDLRKLQVESTGPLRTIANLFSNKIQLADTLRKYSIPTPPIYKDKSAITAEHKYIVKPAVGGGSSGVRVVNGTALILEDLDFSKFVVQDLCDVNDGEITAEVFNYNGEIKIFQRKRIETKAGVCVKCERVEKVEINNILYKLVKLYYLPRAFCVQFMKWHGQWAVVDFNLRMGAGTAMASAYGFQLVRAFVATLMDEEVLDDWFQVDDEIRSVLRVYQEVVIKDENK